MKDRKIATSSKTNMANMKLLTSDFEFKQIVERARKYLRVPEAGLQDDKENQKWWEELYTWCDEVIETPGYFDRGQKIHDSFRSGKIDRKEFNRRINLYNEEVPINFLRSRERFVVDKFNC